MEASPLIQQARPSFQPKIVRLYEQLFQEDNEEGIVHPGGFWTEFFLLKPDRESLRRRLEALTADDLLHFQHESQQLFLYALQHVKAAEAPMAEVALDTLTVFLAGVLTKRYTNPSSDIITVLTGLDKVDVVFSDLANAIEVTIRNGRSPDVRRKAIEVALSITAGAYQTSLVSYFTHRDLFPALMKHVQESTSNDDVLEPFLLLGLLANYNKFEFRNPYRLRLEDFVNEVTVQIIVRALGRSFVAVRSKYIDVLEDQPDTSWTLSNTLAFIGLGVLAPIRAINADEGKEKFTVLPEPKIAALLTVYDFAHANTLFCFNFVTWVPESRKEETPFSAFLSLASYVLHHAHRSPRASLYGLLSLTILRIIVEDPALCKRLCDPSSTIAVRLCRQRAPFLPPTLSPRPGAAQIFDIVVDTLNHNLRRRLDLDIYIAALNLIHRLLVCLAQNHIRLPYQWPLLWQSLLSLLRFLQTYASDLAAQFSPSEIKCLNSTLLKALAVPIAHGSAFLPDPTAADDLFYKLVEFLPVLEKFRTAFQVNMTDNPLEVLLRTAQHFQGVLEVRVGKGMASKSLSTREVGRVIRQGYESLEVLDVTGMGLEVFVRWREGDEKTVVKKWGRIAVDDAKALIRER